jgi:hypothetical protein
MKIPIKQGIESGSWFQCSTGGHSFRIKLNAFERVNMVGINEPEKIDTKFDLQQGDFWLLKFDVINLTKQTITSGDMFHNILIIDQDNFEFSPASEPHLSVTSNYAEPSGLNAFILLSMYPKIKYPGAELFFLPKEDNAKYFFSVPSGNIKEL